jgi:hypothetical protein
MSDGADELALPPGENITICRTRSVGWYVVFDREIIACFETMEQLTKWLDECFGPLDNAKRADPLPSVLLEQAEQPRKSIWSVIRGGRN